MSNTVTIKWVNHASYILNFNDVSLIADPWLFGTAFNNGWRLISETKFKPEQFDTITHIWFSHEHPDHFSPAVLGKIPEEIRKKITVLFQFTQDRKVINYCKNLGFQTLEMKIYQPYTIGKDFKIMCGTDGRADSWLLSTVGELKILNLNDYVTQSIAESEKIKEHTGEVDILLTQFSYANWTGNPEDVELRKKAARTKVISMQNQVSVLKPKHLIPFASYVYFSHEENFYMNDSINKIDSFTKEIKETTSSIPVVMYPDDVWEVGAEWDNTSSISKYMADYQKLSEPVDKASQPIAWEELQTLSKQYLSRIYNKNSRLLIWIDKLLGQKLCSKTTFYLWDLKLSASFSAAEGLKLSKLSENEADIQLSSESLAYIFKFHWGLGTLLVNGRCRSKQPNLRKLNNAFRLSNLNNHGLHLKFSSMFKLLYRKLKINN